VEAPLTQNIRPGGEPLELKAYEKAGGFQGLRKALSLDPREVQETVKRSALRGRGGAGFPTGEKWSFVPMGSEARRPKYMIVNADEMEPGAWKDRMLLEGDPLQLIEGALIAAYAIEAEVIYIYLRWAYKLGAERLRRAIAQAYQGGYLGKAILGTGFSPEMHLHVSAGRYMCGEESGLLDALEGRRAIPRSKPPFPQTCGLWGNPTVVNNAETVSNLPHILAKGPEWFKSLSRCPDGGTKIFGASGRVRSPGLWELPMGTSVREILEQRAGGMKEGYRLRGLLPGGGSTDFILPEHLDVSMDFTSLQKVGSRMGTGTMIVLDDRTCPVGMVLSLERFFARESCGWCTPCREGLPWVVRALEAIEEGRGEPEDLEILEEHASKIAMGRTFCALAPGAMEPLGSALKHYREDFQRHIREKACPWR
jgi:NADH-quinone oxidoreductase subunit F